MNRKQDLRCDLSFDQVRSLLSYEPDTGDLRWKVNRRGAVKAGDKAGTINADGYIAVRVLNQQHKAHRLAWLLMHRSWPHMHIDHINGRRDDNRACNLRQADYQLNMENLRSANSRSKCRLIGVAWHEGRQEWRAAITRKGVRTNLGRFKTAEEAHVAYLHAKRSMHSGCTI